MAKYLKSVAAKLFVKANGMKTAIVVMLDAKIAPQTSAVPWPAASEYFFPIDMCR